MTSSSTHPQLAPTPSSGSSAISYDMKSEVAACLLAATAAVDADLEGAVVVAAVADEEHASYDQAVARAELRASELVEPIRGPAPLVGVGRR